MQTKTSTMQLALTCAAMLLCTSSAVAQADPEAGDVAPPSSAQGGAHFGAQFGAGAQAQGSAQPEPQSQIQAAPAPSSSSMAASSTASDASASSAAPAPSGNDDHSAAVGHFGVGFFGVMSVPLMGCGMGFPPCAIDDTNELAAPTIGMRYWLDDLLGIEGGLGLNVTSSSSAGVDKSAFGMALHAGVPLALAHSGHFVFEVVPMLNVGFASGSYKTTVVGVTASTDVSGWMVEVGGKAGAEIHFGFIGVPQLSLQGTLGLMIRHDARSAKIPGGLASATVDQKQTSVATGVDGSPWDIFRAAVAAIYYFY
jgi:hypothetical protein